MKHVNDHTLLPAHQSAYRRFHSTETAIAAVHNDLIRAADDDHVTALVLLDLSSAFDTVDHDILLSVLAKRFGIDGVALRWFQSYFQDRSPTFVVNGKSSTTHHVNCSVPQSSCLGPVEFITFTESVTSVFGRHRINHHLFAKQAYVWMALMMCAADFVTVPPTSSTGVPPIGFNSTRARHSSLGSVSALVSTN